MFCIHCGNKIEASDKFCTECGNLTAFKKINIPTAQKIFTVSDEKWWWRFLKVSYIFLCLQILWIVPVVWESNSSSYVGGYYSRYEDTYGQAFWYSILTMIIFIAITRLIKITVLYVVTGRKPNWKSEFKKLY